ncbi:MAG: hypothetical protein ACYDGM_12805 [Vulcanimicrobiaceae bacterium]
MKNKVPELAPTAADPEEAKAAMQWILARRWKLRGMSTKGLVSEGRHKASI